MKRRLGVAPLLGIADQVVALLRLAPDRRALALEAARSFVEQTCRKAGLPADAWQHGAKLWRFEAEVFAENTQS